MGTQRCRRASARRGRFEASTRCLHLPITGGEAGVGLPERHHPMCTSGAATSVATEACPTRPQRELTPWEEAITGDLAQTVGCEGKSVLEIGGDLPPQHALDVLKAAYWTSLDLGVKNPIRDERYALIPGDARDLPFPDESADVVYSSCAFEHIHDFPRAVAEMKRVLRPGGELFSCWGPIWSSAWGNHVWVHCEGRLLTFNHEVLPPWAHLLCCEPELASFLACHLPAERAASVAHWVRHDPYLNRLFCDDYVGALDAAGFSSGSLDPWGPKQLPSSDEADRLEAAWPGKGPFHIYGLRCHAVK